MVVESTETAILDAALGEVLDHGIRRTSVSDIARRCGISRQTLYRYWPDAQAVFAALVTRELMAAVPTGSRPPHDRSELVGLLVDIADRVRGMPLVERLRDTDPELFARYILERLGTSQRAMLARLDDLLRTAQSAGLVRSGDVPAMSAMVLLIAQSAVQSAPLVADRLGDEAWTRELGRALDGYLAAP